MNTRTITPLPPADFTPETGNYKTLQPFRYWCQKVLPLVYDDSISYYELLCKVVDYLNKTMENVETLHSDVTAMHTAYEQLQNYVNMYFSSLDVQQEINNKLDEMVANGEFAEILFKYTKVRINVAWLVTQPLSDNNISEAILSALNISKYIYIPKGTFSFNIEINTDADIECDNTTIMSPNTNPIIRANNCSFSLKGCVIDGGDISSRTLRVNSESTGLIELINCKNNSISDINIIQSNFPNVFLVQDCFNTVFNNISSNNTLFSVIHILYHCVNTTVKNCTFKNVLIPNKEGVYYCYCVFTGAKKLSDNFTPPDGLVYENNYCYMSEDSALDTHGATNVIIRNNRIEQCNTAITVYNDNRRVTRPNGWIMENIIVENNICISTFKNQYTNHPFTIMGSVNSNEIGIKNISVKNNIFDSINDNGKEGIIYLIHTENAIIENNVFNGNNEVSYAIRMNVVHNVLIKNNTFKQFSDTCIFPRCTKGEIKNNIYDKNFIYIPTTSYVHFRGLDALINKSTLEYGEVITLPDNRLNICGTNGISRYRTDITPITAECSVIGNTITLTETDNEFIPDLRFEMDGYACYINEWVSASTFTFRSSHTFTNGNYTITVPVSDTVPTELSPKLLTNGQDLNNLTAGIYYSNSPSLTQSLLNKPTELSDEFTLYVNYFGVSSNNNYLSFFIPHGSKIYSKLKLNGTAYNWYTFNGV